MIQSTRVRRTFSKTELNESGYLKLSQPYLTPNERMMPNMAKFYERIGFQNLKKFSWLLQNEMLYRNYAARIHGYIKMNTILILTRYRSFFHSSYFKAKLLKKIYTL